MSVFSSEDQARVANAIEEAEANTSGEIVVMVAKRSDDYRFIALLWAALIALFLPLVLIYAPRLTGWRLAFAGPEMIYLIQLAWFIILGLVFQIPQIRMLLAPPSVKKARAHKNALEQFIAQGLHSTDHRTGVLIFVSIAERYAEIIADERIAKQVDDGVWKQAVDSLTGEVGKQRAADGFILAIKQCGIVLAEHFPPGALENNELPNHVIELD